MLVLNTESSLQSQLSFSHASEAFDGGTLTGVLIHARRNSLEKPIQNVFPSHEVSISSKRDQPMGFMRS